MAKPHSARHTLSPRFVETSTTPGLFADGGCLYHRVQMGARGISKSWVFRYRQNGKLRSLGLGSFPEISLKHAREMAEENRRLLILARHGEGRYPLEIRRESQSKRRLSFSDAASAYIKKEANSWKKGSKSEAQWQHTLVTYINPLIGDYPVSQIALNDVKKVLDPIWLTKPETARRVRSRIKRVLDFASVTEGMRIDNPARWEGGLKEIMPKQPAKKEHHAAMPYEELPSFWRELSEKDSISARALQWTILSAARTNEVLAMTADQIQGQVWVVPGQTMKNGKAHRVPITPQMRALLPDRAFGIVWQGPKGELSNAAMYRLLKKRMNRDYSVHGFRSSFRDWVAETQPGMGDAAERQLSHVNSNETEAAYLRTDLLGQRSQLMSAWAQFVTGEVK